MADPKIREIKSMIDSRWLSLCFRKPAALLPIGHQEHQESTVHAKQRPCSTDHFRLHDLRIHHQPAAGRSTIEHVASAAMHPVAMHRRQVGASVLADKERSRDPLWVEVLWFISLFPFDIATNGGGLLLSRMITAENGVHVAAGPAQ